MLEGNVEGLKEKPSISILEGQIILACQEVRLT